MPNPIDVRDQVEINPDGGIVYVRVYADNMGGSPGFFFSSVIATLAGNNSPLPDINNPLNPKRVGDPALLLNGGQGRSLVVATADDMDTLPQDIALICDYLQDGEAIYHDRQAFTLSNSQTVRWHLKFVNKQNNNAGDND